MAVTAHEVGHAQQDAEGTFAMKARAFLVPAVTFSPMASYALIFIGLIFNLTGLFWLGIIVVRRDGRLQRPDPAGRDRRQLGAPW